MGVFCVVVVFGDSCWCNLYVVYPITFVYPHFDFASIVHAAPSTIRAPGSLRRHRSVKARSPALPIGYTT